ncbi:MAG: GNAT family N-acetyltransferase [Halieaceae bacterium]|nr:GNAT family N-acetyltransferase [Halieaceae bacterium]
MLRDSGDTRAAVVDDCKDLATLNLVNDLRLNVTQIRKFIEDDLTHFTLLILNEKLKGFAISGGFVADEITLMHIFISPDQRKRGLGEKLLTDNLYFWRGKGAKRCLLELRMSNNEAKNFYTKRGFTVDGFRPNYYLTNDFREDAILMSLPL